jgi:hypothetical protein
MLQLLFIIHMLNTNCRNVNLQKKEDCRISYRFLENVVFMNNRAKVICEIPVLLIKIALLLKKPINFIAIGQGWLGAGTSNRKRCNRVGKMGGAGQL